MNLGKLKEMIKDINDDELEIFIRNSNNPCGNIARLEQIELSTYGCFGKELPCLILKSNNSRSR